MSGRIEESDWVALAEASVDRSTDDHCRRKRIQRAEVTTVNTQRRLLTAMHL